jgi:hypothetical protein
MALGIRQKSSVPQVLHLLLTILLPLLVFVLVRIDFYQLAIVMILLSKWRMFAVKPRHWAANIRANTVDIIVSLSFVVFMVHSSAQTWQFLWAVAYGLWLVALKPGTSLLKISLQALCCQVLGLSAIFLNFKEGNLVILVLLAWVVCYSAARHFFTGFEEGLTRFLAYVWGYFGAALTWLLGHWLLYYGSVAQPTLLLSVLAFGLGSLYYLDKTDRLSVFMRRQFIFIMIAIVLIIIVFSEWGDKTI